MTRMVAALAILLLAGNGLRADQPVNWGLESAPLSACPWNESCFLVDLTDVQWSANREGEVWQWGTAWLKSAAAKSQGAFAVRALQASWRGLTWTGAPEDAIRPAAAVSTTQETRAKEPVAVARIILAEEPAEEVALFDVAAAVAASESELAHSLPTQPAPVSRMDDYWLYYSDCDRWDVSFLDPPRFSIEPEANPSSPLQTAVRSARAWYGLAAGALQAGWQNALEKSLEVEFYLWEVSRPDDFDSRSEVIEGLLDWLAVRRAEVRQWGAATAESLVRQWHQPESRLGRWARVIESEWAAAERRHQAQLAKAYFGPRLSWLGRQLDQAGRALQPATNVARRSASVSTK